MGWFTKKTAPVGTGSTAARGRKTQLLVDPAAVADFGRWTLLKENSGVNLSEYSNMSPQFASGLDIVRPLFDQLYMTDPNDPVGIVRELEHHSQKGVWEAVGAWRFCDEFLDSTPELWSHLEDAGIRALAQMNITNLSFNLGIRHADAYRRITGEKPPNDGFFGPPVFNSAYGPSLDFYINAAREAAAARTPLRVQEARGQAPDPTTADLTGALWDFAMLVYRGPAIAPNIDPEPTLLRPAIEAAYAVDHEQFAKLLLAQVASKSGPDDAKWPALGAARFIEDYLDPRVTGTSAHLELIDLGLAWLREPGAAVIAVTATAVLSPIAAARWETPELRS